LKYHLKEVTGTTAWEECMSKLAMILVHNMVWQVEADEWHPSGLSGCGHGVYSSEQV
jgi:hypothetical protein